MERLGPILVDVSAVDEPTLNLELLSKLGHPVQVCHGPTENTVCPVLAGQPCDMVESANGVIFELDLDRPQHRAILLRYTEILAEDIPLRVVVKPGQREKYADLLTRVEVWDHSPTTGELDGFAASVETYDEIAGR